MSRYGTHGRPSWHRVDLGYVCSVDTVTVTSYQWYLGLDVRVGNSLSPYNYEADSLCNNTGSFGNVVSGWRPNATVQCGNREGRYGPVLCDASLKVPHHGHGALSLCFALTSRSCMFYLLPADTFTFLATVRPKSSTILPCKRRPFDLLLNLCNSRGHSPQPCPSGCVRPKLFPTRGGAPA